MLIIVLKAQLDSAGLTAIGTVHQWYSGVWLSMQKIHDGTVSNTDSVI